VTGVAEERMEEEVKQDTSETETQEKRNTEECEETAEASAENTGGLIFSEHNHIVVGKYFKRILI